MFLYKRARLLSMILIIALLLSGCNYSIQKVVPTVDPAVLQATVDASVVQALQATAISLTSTALAMPTATATETATATLEPTATATATLEPTATATATATATSMPPTNTYIPPTQKPSATPTPLAYSCSVTSTTPSSGTKLKLGVDFDGVWKVKNTGTKDWQAGYIDLVYVNGTKMQTNGNVFDVNVSLAKGAETTIILDMLAPATAGKYSETFQLVMEGTVMCVLPLSIEAVP